MKRDTFKTFASVVAIVLAVVLAVVLAIVVSNNLPSEARSENTQYDEKTTASKNETVFMFHAVREQEYLDFLEDFDYSKYVIVERTILPETFSSAQQYLVLYTIK